MQGIYQVVYIDRNFISNRYPNKPTDGDKFFTYGFASLYARQFKKFNPDIHVECWKADPRIKYVKEKEIEGVFYRMFPSLNFGKFGQYSWQMIRFLKKWNRANTNTVFNISSFDHLLFYSLAGKLKNQPLVVQNHGESTAIYKKTIKKGIRKFYYIFLAKIEKHFFKNVDLVYVIDERLKQWIPLNKKGILVKLSTTGVDENIFHTFDKQEARKELGLDVQKKYILYVGRLNHTKRTDLLIKIFKDLKKEHQNVELILAGTSSTDVYFPEAIESGAIIYGVIPQNILYKYLSAVDIYILARYSEHHTFGGIGMLPVQAMFCNTPVIGDSLHNFPEIDREHVGIHARDEGEILNAIKSILNDQKAFHAARTYSIKYYSWKIIGINTAQDYRKLFQK